MTRSTLLPLPTHTPDVYEQVRETARRFADARIRPRANELDQSEARLPAAERIDLSRLRVEPGMTPL